MSDYGDLLTETDPFLAWVRTAASRHAGAFDWFAASAAGWARAEFVRRVDVDDVTPGVIDRLLHIYVGRQVALLTTHLNLGATTGPRTWWACSMSWTCSSYRSNGESSRGRTSDHR